MLEMWECYKNGNNSGTSREVIHPDTVR